MIGDQIETDIAGAVAAGIDSALVATGVSVETDNLPFELRPTWQLGSVAMEGSGGDGEAQQGQLPDEIDK
jgi:ribonucleotide monophosphatase NagD (HAD superfamily)